MKRRKIVGSVVIVGVLALVTLLAAKGTRNESENGRSVSRAGIELLNSANEELGLSDFKGKVVFINNWASWCPPCTAEMPSIQELKSKLEGEEVVFVMVSFDQDSDRAKAFLKRRSFDFEVYFPGEAYPYFTESIPATFILNKRGEVVSEHIGMSDYSSDEFADKLKELANE